MTAQRRPATYYERLGYQTMREKQDESLARQICGLHLRALAAELEPGIRSCESGTAEDAHRAEALCDQLYNRPHPVSDLAMLARGFVLLTASIVLASAVLASAANHAQTFMMFGWPVTRSMALGAILTALATAVGHQLFEQVITRPTTRGLVAAAAFTCCFWGLVQLVQARSEMSGVAASREKVQSFVESTPVTEASAEIEIEPPQSRRRTVGEMLGSAVAKFMIAADIVAGMLLGVVTALRADADFAAWRHVRRLKRRIARRQAQLERLRSALTSASSMCAAGILRAKHPERRSALPYFRALSILTLTLPLGTGAVRAQDAVSSYEVHLIDVSGSISNSGGSLHFRDYLLGVRRLIETTPPETRIWVELISTDSFGGVQTLVRGWTPSVQGVFTDDLDRARRQLAAAFASKAKGLQPMAAGTDITGGLWRAKSLLESAAGAPGGKAMSIFVWSDMMNETAVFNMPALLSTGADSTLARVRAHGLLVPLDGVRVHVFGATTARMSPQTWNAVRAFWTAYFRAAGADLMTYSAETTASRDLAGGR